MTASPRQPGHKSESVVLTTREQKRQFGNMLREVYGVIVPVKLLAKLSFEDLQAITKILARTQDQK